MTAPMDIGMEQSDSALRHGQEDIFDLDDASKGLRKKGGLSRLMDESDVESDNEVDGEGLQGESSDDEILDEDEERERKVGGLEDELDGLYDSYQERLRERDAKYRVREARRNNKEREEWHGIQAKKSDDEDDDSEEEGGWDKMEAVKARAGEESSSGESDEDEDESSQVPSKKRRQGILLEDSSKRQKRLRFENDMPASLSRAAQVWFSQDCFAGTELGLNLDEIEDSEGDVPEDSDNDASEPEEDVSTSLFCADTNI